MKTVYSDAHHLHAPALELAGSRFVPAYEQPVRADSVLDRVASSRLIPSEPPHDLVAPIRTVHAISSIFGSAGDWSAAGDTASDCLVGPHADGARLCARSRWAGSIIRSTRRRSPAFTANHAGNYVDAGSYLARGDRSAFGLCRPPGHHASRDYCGGYCYLNNAAIAAQSLLDAGGARVAILDVDYHHGNGTQSIFYDRNDVLFVSIHADPDEEYPYFLGYADETGVGRGAGYNLNLPLPVGTGAAEWFDALSVACERIVPSRRCAGRLARRRR
jgi:acetoin utilization deacetylase AcuC-like enzyme